MTTDILVIGKTGQLARCLAEQAGQADDMSFEFWGRDSLDLAADDDIAGRIESRAPDFVVNAAAYTAVDKAEDEIDLAMRINGDAPGEIAKGAAACGAVIIQVSTDYVFDGELTRAYREDDEPNPQGVYGRSKLEGERAVAAANPRHLIARTAWVYSVHGNNFVKTMMRLAGERDEVSVVDDQLGNPTSAHDLAEALVSAIRKLSRSDDPELYGIYNVAGSGTASWCEVASGVFFQLASLGSSVPKLRAITTADFPTKASRPASSRLNVMKFERAFGLQMPYWDISLGKVVSRLLDQH